jgi:YbgC/YbaW family acyl-CoA thioester hydrolase
VDLKVYPDQCDSYGHLNQAALVSLLERARWEVVARGPGMDYFGRHRIWPALRKSTIEYHAQAFPGDILRCSLSLVYIGRTSFVLRQAMRRVGDDALVATSEMVFVCIDPSGAPTPVPEDLNQVFADRSPGGTLRRLGVNGVSLTVDIRGRGPAILFIHGYPLNHGIWEPQLAGLEGWTRIAPDLRGMGQSDAPDLGYSMATYAEDLLALLSAVGVERTVLCGLSMGGYVAFEMLRRAPERVRGLILLDTRAEADTPEGRKGRETAMALAREGGAVAIAETLLPKMLSPSVFAENPALVERVRQMMAATPVAGMTGAIAALRDRPDSTALLGALSETPTLVVVGEHDQITTPDTVRAMAEAIPGARFKVVKGAGHLPTLERPESTTALLGEVLAGLS